MRSRLADSAPLGGISGEHGFATLVTLLPASADPDPAMMQRGGGYRESAAR